MNITEFVKYANEEAEEAKPKSSFLGTYFNTHALPSSKYLRSPGYFPLALAGSSPLVASTGIPEMLANRGILGKGEEAKAQELRNSSDELKGMSHGRAFLEHAKRPALLGGLGGALIGALGNYHTQLTPTDIILRGLLGAGVGAAGFGISGGLGGNLNKYIADNTTDASRDAAISLKSRRPNLSALPLGDVIGALGRKG